jgi:hypothetical protein
MKKRGHGHARGKEDNGWRAGDGGTSMASRDGGTRFGHGHIGDQGTSCIGH